MEDLAKDGNRICAAYIAKPKVGCDCLAAAVCCAFTLPGARAVLSATLVFLLVLLMRPSSGSTQLARMCR
eukprot:11159233-Lingulodinium_polyedra.AAC.1